MKRASRFTVAVAVCLSATPAASGAAQREVTLESLALSGSLTYSWHGDPARGCARENLCDVRGSLTFEPTGGGDLSTPGSLPALLSIDGNTTVRVRRGSGGAAGDCVELATDDTRFMSLPRRRSSVTSVGGDLDSSGRCAGPLAQDLAGIRIPFRANRRRQPSFFFLGEKPFVAGPLGGMMVSTLVARSDPQHSSSGSSGSELAPTRHRQLLERVELRYRVTGLPGALAVSFHSRQDPFCFELDNCGLDGTIGVSFPAVGATFTLTAFRPVPHRVGRATAIADLRAGRLSASGSVPDRGSLTSQTAETLTRAGAAACQDTAAGHGSSLFLSELPGHPLRLSAELPAYGGEDDVFRTHCPGPQTSDVLGVGPDSIAQGSLTIGQLLAPHAVLALSHPRAFAGAAYRGTFGGAVTLSLSLLSVRAGSVLIEDTP